MKTWLEISITSTPSQRELLLPGLTELGCQGFQELDDALLCYFDKSQWDSTSYERFLKVLRSILQMFSVNADIRFREIEETNWNETWERSLAPVEIGRRLVVKPSWTEYRGGGERIIIEIDPKMSFGTGYHESTRLILALLETHVRPGDTVLDIGTGTGVLAIASVKLGAEKATGIDTDNWSIENARENVVKNNVQDSVDIPEVPLTSFATAGFSLIVANIMASTIIELLPQIRRLLAPGGRLLLSGLLATDREEIERRLAEFGFRPTASVAEHEWIAIAAGRT